MATTRRHLDAENKQLRAQLEAAKGETRKSLVERLKKAEARVKELEMKYGGGKC